jgi:ribosomal protein S12 methylthiotransferase
MERIHIVTLGCSKNTVDTEYMLGLLKDNYILTSDIMQSDIVIINTCTFINDAKQESIEAIFDAVSLKKEGKIKKIILAGCLSQRYAEELLNEIPEIDIFVGTSNYDKILEFLKDNNVINCVENPSRNMPDKLPRIITESGHYSFVKISEGCDNLCTYCVIPMVRGKYRSRAIEDILDEVSYLVSKGIKEIIIIAQDTSKYGIDIYGEKRLHDLLHQISCIKGVEWIRVHYIYPEDFYDELVNEFEKNDKLLKYFEIPLQHINDQILKRMNRKTNRKQITELIKKIRSKFQGAIIRTTFIVGFPGETEEQFLELKEFIIETKFDRLGVFAYSEEEDTPAVKFPNKVEEEIKEIRKNELMRIQQQISLYKNNLMKGKVLKVIIDEENDNEEYIGRTYMDSPEIDGIVYIHSSKKIFPGDIVEVIIKDSTEYDLIGELYEFAK